MIRPSVGKTELRAAALRLRSQHAAETAGSNCLASDYKLRLCRNACRRTLSPDDMFAGVRVVAGYLALPGEADPMPLMNCCVDAGIEVVVPAWSRVSKRYSFCRWRPGVKLSYGPMRVTEPDEKIWIPFPRIDLVLIPGLMFGLDGVRIGFGGGHYDRLLSRCHRNTHKIGIAFDWQVTRKKLPSEKHDVLLDAILML